MTQLSKFYPKKSKRYKQRKETYIEKAFRILLQDMGLPFHQELWLEYRPEGTPIVWKRRYDFYLYGGNYEILIEIDGLAVHSRHYLKDGKIKPHQLNKMQRRNLRNDKLKDLICEKLNIPLLRFREDDINQNILGVKKTLVDEINRQVKLGKEIF